MHQCNYQGELPGLSLQEPGGRSQVITKDQLTSVYCLKPLYTLLGVSQSSSRSFAFSLLPFTYNTLVLDDKSYSLIGTLNPLESQRMFLFETLV